MIVQTKLGYVRGCEENEMLAFKGIPYAKAPIGELRWKPPAAHEIWDDVFDATNYGARAIQRHETRYTDDNVYSEDCLNLCVWTPACDNAQRPVVVYIHGGGHFEGSNSDIPYDGPHLVGGHDTVMVSINYRLGILGYLYLGGVLGEEYAASGNCGLLDQIFALRWVRDNITAFGGDPENVTIMGQSAGGKSVAALMMTPLAKGLFHKAIIQSGGVQCIRDIRTAETLLDYHLSALGLSRNDAKRILTMTSVELLEAQAKISDKYVAPWHAYGPVADGVAFECLPENGGYLADCPVLIGYTSEELYSSVEDDTVNDETILRKLQWNFGTNAPAVENWLQSCGDMHKSLALGKAMSHFVYHLGGNCMIRRLAKAGNPMYAYLWDYHGDDTPHHFSEMRFVFRYSKQEYDGGYGDGEAALAACMNDAWNSFIRSGKVEKFNWKACAQDAPEWLVISENRIEMQPWPGMQAKNEIPEQVICY